MKGLPMTTDLDSPVPSLPVSLGWSIVLAVLMTLVGLFAIIVPIVSGIAATLVVGWFFSVMGILHFLFAWKTHTTSGVLWEILLGVLYLFSGFYLLFHPLAGLASLTLLLAAYLLVKGVLQIVHYFQMQPRHGSGWLLFDGIVSLILAVMIWRAWPFSSVWVIGTLVGISLLFTGFSRLMISLTARKMMTASSV
jgi:uncharacterized membrane protein HdeD (DUF308 family)